MIMVWNNQKADDPEAARLIQPGLDKLAVYLERTDVVPAYIVSMSKLILDLKFIYIPYSFFSRKVLTPSMKLRFYTEHHPEKVEWAKDVFLREVSHANLFLTTPFSDLIRS